MARPNIPKVSHIRMNKHDHRKVKHLNKVYHDDITNYCDSLPIDG